MTEDRAPCLVPGCGRTIARADHPPHYDEFICSTHWRLVSAALKRVKRRHEREFKKFGFYPRDVARSRIWRRCKREAGA